MDIEALQKAQDLITEIVDAVTEQAKTITGLQEAVDKYINYLQSKVERLRDA